MLDPETASRVRIVLRHMRSGRAISESQYERARRTDVQISARALARR
jgi:membrane peptidoglycan carboxypeptidase